MIIHLIIWISNYSEIIQLEISLNQLDIYIYSSYRYILSIDIFKSILMRDICYSIIKDMSDWANSILRYLQFEPKIFLKQ